jgi:ZIP family zinc transporter
MNSDIFTMLLFALAAGLCIPLGGFLAKIEHISPNWLDIEFRHFMIALGGGILVGATAMVLIPEGLQFLDHSPYAVLFLLVGGFCFYLLELFLGLKKREAPQLSGLLLDYIPESLALGGMLALGATSAPLLALLIGLQNIPEGFNAYRELVALNNQRAKRVFIVMLALAPIGPIFAVFGYMYFAGNTYLLGATLLFASGGILYLIFQDIAPQAKLKRHWAPPLGAVLGFAIAMLGTLLVGEY